MLLFKRFLRLGIKSILTLVVFALFLIGLQYLSTSIYQFSPQDAFSGKNWNNPYQFIDSIQVKANFHAHSCAWGKLTYGENYSKEMVNAYREKGYDIAPMSNYFMLDTTGKAANDLFVPVYEHGLNIFKTHCLGINAKRVSHYDYFLFQTPSHQQKVINKLVENGAVVALAHPELSQGRSLEDLSYLNHYPLVEVLNHYRISDEHWDAALSAGRLVYVLANDDSHQLDTTVMFRMWNVILPKKRTKEAVLSALVHGQAYGVHTLFNKQQNALKACRVVGNTLTVELTGMAEEIQFIGQGGKIVQKTPFTHLALYTLRPTDTYIRIVAKNSESALYLNPITRFNDHVRYNKDIVPQEKTLQTWLFRALIFCIELSLLYFLYRIWRRKKRVA